MESRIPQHQPNQLLRIYREGERRPAVFVFFCGLWVGTCRGWGGCTIPFPPLIVALLIISSFPPFATLPRISVVAREGYIFFSGGSSSSSLPSGRPPPLLAAAALLLAVAVGTANGKKHGWRRRRVLIRLRDSPLQASPPPPPPPLFLIGRIFWGRREEGGWRSAGGAALSSHSHTAAMHGCLKSMPLRIASRGRPV